MESGSRGSNRDAPSKIVTVGPLVASRFGWFAEARKEDEQEAQQRVRHMLMAKTRILKDAAGCGLLCASRDEAEAAPRGWSIKLWVELLTKGNPILNLRLHQGQLFRSPQARSASQIKTPREGLGREERRVDASEMATPWRMEGPLMKKSMEG